MKYTFTARDGYLRADLFDRNTPEETRIFLEALAAQVLKGSHARVLIAVHRSRAIFKVQDYEASSFLQGLAARKSVKVALLADREDVRSSHEYIQLLAGQRGAQVRSFGDDAAAIAWLTGEPAGSPSPKDSAHGSMTPPE